MFENSSNRRYIGYSDGTTKCLDELMKTFDMKKASMRHNHKNIDLMVQEFAVGKNGAHKFWMISSFQDD